MATFPDECVRVNVIWKPDQDSWPNEQAVNTFWLHHFHFTGNDWDWDRDLQTIVDGCAAKFQAHWGDVSGLFGAGYQISQFKASKVDSLGHDTNQKVHPVVSGTLPGTGTSGVLPPEVSLVLSLFGYPAGGFVSQRGRKRGRLFLPYISAGAVDTHGKLSTSQKDACLTGFGNIFNDIQGMHAGNPVPPGNSSDYMQLAVVSGTGGIWTQVDHLAVDDHFDAQRRRQHQSPPNTFTTPINHS